MSFTKNRDWVVGTDGEMPVTSKRHAGKSLVVLDGPDGEYFGWEDSNGKLFVGTRLTFDAGAQTVRNDAATAASDFAAKGTTFNANYATLKAKRAAGTALDMDDLNMLADLFFKLDLE
jgi:hypothetical protein